MRLYTSIMVWGTIAGIALGAFGLPVRVPATSWWTWFSPLGFRTASMLSIGTLGFLVGLLVDLIRVHSRTRVPEIFFWCNGFAIVALLVSIVQIYRLAASDAEENWSTVTNCLIASESAAQVLAKNPSHTDLESVSTELREAGAKLYVVSRYYDRDRQQNISMENVSAGLTGAGIMLLSSNPGDVNQAKQFIQHTAEVFTMFEKRANGAYSQQTAQAMLNAISSTEPTAWNQYYGVP
ncbi:hypothetical protein NZD89_08305 [Alicyclobacillus fastidiosus]|uniref:Uncharacterized protein n=1 Tax=Alicyclobacillus fastidiosus TaxID=392011 RepID=A0ABY6ZKB6_9BACL|nr:hypothetical protein [Alicyclobacillus fastidiosus]WAH43378.1 hypothetical protein NZD89_08305 [Alicyclobacillus fastidiosus]GMA65440.1 hypothetical protein GCM10025859_58800 [Alicyclobacillus fastidiosus]